MKTAFLFSGQGSQYPGMFKEIYEGSEAARDKFQLADSRLGRKVSELCFYGTKEELSQTINTQVCVLACDLAAAAALTEAGIAADGVAGFSLGEYAALAYAGAISYETVYSLVSVRAMTMQEAVPEGKGAMAAIMKLSSEIVKKLCDATPEHYVALSNYNSPTQVVISGEKIGVEAVCAKAKEAGGIATMLDVSVPSHCKLMKPAVDHMEDELKREGNLKVPEIPVYANVTTDLYPMSGDAKTVRELMLKQLTNPVRWQETIENMYADGYDTFIECGPGTTLSGLVKRILKGMNFRVFNMQTPDDLVRITEGRQAIV